MQTRIMQSYFTIIVIAKHARRRGQRTHTQPTRIVLHPRHNNALQPVARIGVADGPGGPGGDGGAPKRQAKLQYLAVGTDMDMVC